MRLMPLLTFPITVRLSNYLCRSIATQALKDNDPYAVLQITRDATFQTLKESYLRLSKLYHPDVNSNQDSQEKFKAINSAYKQLKEQFEREGKVEFVHNQQPQTNSRDQQHSAKQEKVDIYSMTEDELMKYVFGKSIQEDPTFFYD